MFGKFTSLVFLISVSSSFANTSFCTSEANILESIGKLQFKIEQLQEEVKILKAGKSAPNPVCREPCPDAWISFKGSCYWFPRIDCNFYDASDICEEYESHLVFVESFAENSFIQNHLRSLNDRLSWMGLTDIETEGLFRFYGTTKSPSFTNWGPGEPSGGSEDCGCLWRDSNFRWNDCSCQTLAKPVCEK